jgi:hypothetical protein
MAHPFFFHRLIGVSVTNTNRMEQREPPIVRSTIKLLSSMKIARQEGARNIDWSWAAE